MIQTKFFAEPFRGFNAALNAHREKESKLLELINNSKDNDTIHSTYCKIYSKLIESKAEVVQRYIGL